MTDDLKAFGVLARDNRNGRISVDHVGEVHELAVHLARKRSLEKTGANRSRDVADRYRGIELAFTAIGKSNRYHFEILGKVTGIKKVRT